MKLRVRNQPVEIDPPRKPLPAPRAHGSSGALGSVQLRGACLHPKVRVRSTGDQGLSPAGAPRPAGPPRLRSRPASAPTAARTPETWPQTWWPGPGAGVPLALLSPFAF